MRLRMKIYNSLKNQVEDFKPIDNSSVRIYSCGPTVYDRVHIGNLSAFIVADTLRRTLKALDFNVQHVMNLTDVDDKTIKKSAAEYPNLDAKAALQKSTIYYSEFFFEDMKKVGNKLEDIKFVRATDQKTIDGMKKLITDLVNNNIAYIAEDGIYFSIEAYKNKGKKYGQLVEITESNTSNSRVNSDEYDKDTAHDFALWKKAKEGEPFWEFNINNQDLSGRPGWHIECSVMSSGELGQPFDIHTGGIDLKFPHHENEIAQSTALGEDVYAKYFVHNEHILVDGKKMSKSLGNFFTLEDLIKRGVDPLAFRLLVLQSNYQKPTNFSFELAESAHNRLVNWQNVASLRWQIHPQKEKTVSLLADKGVFLEKISNNLNTPEALAFVDNVFDKINKSKIDEIDKTSFVEFLTLIDDTLGLDLLSKTPDIPENAKLKILERERSRENKDWETSDTLREEIESNFKITIKDTPNGTIWSYK